MKEKALVVDDEKDLREILSYILTESGFEVFQAEDGLKGIEVFDQNPDISIVISDIRMPKLDGVELLKHIRSKNKDYPAVIMVSGFADITSKQLYDLGANNFITKPYNILEMMDSLKNYSKQLKSA